MCEFPRPHGTLSGQAEQAVTSLQSQTDPCRQTDLPLAKPDSSLTPPPTKTRAVGTDPVCAGDTPREKDSPHARTVPLQSMDKAGNPSWKPFRPQVRQKTSGDTIMATRSVFRKLEAAETLPGSGRLQV